jgi:hypothetical protein
MDFNLFKYLSTITTERKLAFVSNFFPTYYCSTGAHLVNLENKQRFVYFEHRIPTDLRVHVFMVAPPGFMKSYILFQLLESNFGLISDCKEEGYGTEPDKVGLGTGFEGSMTEAGWTGTIASNDGEPSTVYGAAYEHKLNIVGIEEFSIIADMLKQAHSSTLANQLLTSLDKGFLRKRLGRGKVFYQTHATLWTGSQPARFDMSAGLARRFHFIEFIPTANEKETIKHMRREGQNLQPDAATKLTTRKELITLCKKLKKVNYIAFDSSLHQMFDKHKMLHFEEPLYERLALGYTVMSNKFDEQIIVKLDKDIEDILLQGMTWRRSIKMDSEINQIITLLQDNKGSMTESDVLYGLSDFGVDYIHGTELISRAKRSHRVKSKGDVLMLRWYKEEVIKNAVNSSVGA